MVNVNVMLILDLRNFIVLPTLATETVKKGRGTLGILLFIAGRGRKAYWKRGGWRGGANTIAGCMLLARRATNHIELKLFNAEKRTAE